MQCGSAFSQSLGSDKGTEPFASPNFLLRSKFYKKVQPIDVTIPYLSKTLASWIGELCRDLSKFEALVKIRKMSCGCFFAAGGGQDKGVLSPHVKL